jgi:hypothetical protein
MQFSSTFSALINKTIHYNMFNTPGPISVYSGVQPDATTLENSWSNYQSSDNVFLAHFSAPSWTSNASTMAAGNTCLYTTTTASGNATPLRSGTASWAVIWDSTVVSAPGAGTIPTTKFIICDVGGMLSNAAVRMVDTSVNSSTVTRIEDIGLTIKQP